MKLLKKLLVAACSMVAVQAFASPDSGPGKGNIETLRTGTSIYACDLVNSEDLEFSPAYYHDGLVFVTSRSVQSKKDEQINEPFFELYYAGLLPNGEPMTPWFFSPNLNSRLHEGPVTFSPDYGTIYFTRNNIRNGEAVKDEDGKVHLQIFQAVKSPEDWTDLTVLPFNSDSYNCAHPALSPDGHILFFSSDMPGGYGGMDLYKVEFYDNTWGTPVNLGPTINTSGNEIFPFIHESNTLFFASDGHEGKGGLDIFMVKPFEVVPQLYNLGTPFNSEADDLGILVSTDGKRGYFTSARPGGQGKDDIYRFETPDGLIPASAVDLAVTVADAETGKFIPGAEIRTLQGSADGLLENSELYDLELVPTGNNGEMSLKMIRKSSSQMGNADAVTGSNGTAFITLPGNEHYILYVTKEGYQPKDLFFSTVNSPAFKEITILLQPENCIAMEGKVLDETTGRPIPSAVIKIQNRDAGTEEYVSSTLDGNFTFCLPDGADYTLTAVKDGYHQGIAVVSTKGEEKALYPVITMLAYENSIAKAPLEIGSVIILDKIYYDFDKSYIRTGAARDLDALIHLMKRYPGMEVEMIAHTDSRGTEAYNLRLSERRAASAKEYVTARGISSHRIKAYGVGEAYPRNGCTDGVTCTELEHQYNRRTEIRVVEMDTPVVVNYVDDGPETIDRKNDQD